MIKVDILRQVYKLHDNWEDRTIDYNNRTGESRSEGTLRSNYSRNKNKEDVIKDNTVIQTYEGELVTPDELLIRRGLDPKLFQLRNGKSSYGDIGTTKNEEGRLYNSHLTFQFEPRKFTLSKELLMDMWDSMNIKPIEVKRLKKNGKGLFLISLNDVHIWRNTYEYYKDYVAEIVTELETREWEQVIIKQGGDWFHVNNSQGTTVAGTQVGYEVSKSQLYEEGDKIIQPIIISALKQSRKVKYVYIEGNHDKDLAWGFAYGLKKQFPQVEFNIEEEVYKKHSFHNVLLLMTHGDKPRNLNTLGKVMFELFRQDMALAETVEVHTEHLHHEKVKDDMGMVFRTNPTANATDKYHHEGGFIGARKIFQCFVYNNWEIKEIKHITGRY